MIIVPEQPHTKERDRAGSLTMPHGPAECGTARRILPGHNARPRQPNPRLSGEAGGGTGQSRGLGCPQVKGDRARDRLRRGEPLAVISDSLSVDPG